LAIAGFLRLDCFDAGDSLAWAPVQIGAITLAAQPFDAIVMRLAGVAVLSGNLYLSNSPVKNLSEVVSLSLRTVCSFHGNVFSSRPVHLRRNSWDRAGRGLLPQVPGERIAVRRIARAAFTSSVGSAAPATPTALSIQYPQQHRRADSQ